MIARKRDALSWVRFSTLDQRKGRSGRRQYDIASEVCKKEGWNLIDDPIGHFEGVSAFHGKPIKQFLEYVEDGTIPSDIILIVEQFNRLDRNSPALAFKAFYKLLELGVQVYVYTLETLFTKEGVEARDGEQMSKAIEAQKQASKESDIKRGWGLDNWNNLRKTIANSPKHLAIMRTKTPYGFTVVDDDDGDRVYVPDPIEAPIVKRIYQMSAQGLVAQTIADELNEEGVKPRISKVWNRVSIDKILKSRVYCGEWQPYGRTGESGNDRVPVGDPIPNAFPLIVTAKEFAEGHLVAEPGKRNKRNLIPNNLFAFVGKCAKCGGQVFSYRNKRLKSYRTRCYEHDYHKTCDEGTGINRDFVEASIIDSLLKHLSAKNLKPSANASTEKLKKRLARIEKDIETTSTDIKTIASNMAKEKDEDLYESFKDAYRLAKANLSKLKNTHAEVKRDIDRLSGSHLTERRNEMADCMAQAIFGIPGNIRMTKLPVYAKTKVKGKTAYTKTMKDAKSPWWLSMTEIPTDERIKARKRLKATIQKTVKKIIIDLEARTFMVLLINDIPLTRPNGVGKTSEVFRIYDPTQGIDDGYAEVLDGIYLGWLASDLAPPKVQAKAQTLIAKLEADFEGDSIDLDEWSKKNRKGRAKRK